MRLINGKIIHLQPSGKDGYSRKWFSESLKIGRSDSCEGCINSNEVDEIHCIISLNESGQACICNVAQPAYITRVDEANVLESATLNHRSIITVGNVQLRFEYPPYSKWSKTDLVIENKNPTPLKVDKPTTPKPGTYTVIRHSNGAPIITPIKTPKTKIQTITPDGRLNVRPFITPSQPKSTKNNQRNKSIANLIMSERTRRSKQVSFGPYLSPEQFDKEMPPMVPVKKGATPLITSKMKESRAKQDFSIVSDDSFMETQANKSQTKRRKSLGGRDISILSLSNSQNLSSVSEQSVCLIGNVSPISYGVNKAREKSSDIFDYSEDNELLLTEDDSMRDMSSKSATSTPQQKNTTKKGRRGFSMGLANLEKDQLEKNNAAKKRTYKSLQRKLDVSKDANLVKMGHESIKSLEHSHLEDGSFQDLSVENAPLTTTQKSNNNKGRSLSLGNLNSNIEKNVANKRAHKSMHPRGETVEESNAMEKVKRKSIESKDNSNSEEDASNEINIVKMGRKSRKSQMFSNAELQTEDETAHGLSARSASSSQQKNNNKKGRALSLGPLNSNIVKNITNKRTHKSMHPRVTDVEKSNARVGRTSTKSKDNSYLEDEKQSTSTTNSTQSHRRSLSSKNAEESENTNVKINKDKKSIGDVYLSGVRELLKTPRAQKSMRLSALADLMSTPQDDTEDDVEIRTESVMTKSRRGSNKVTDSSGIGGVKESSKTPRRSGLTDEMNVVSKKVFEDETNLSGLRDLLKTPRSRASIRLSGLANMMETSMDETDSVIVVSKRNRGSTKAENEAHLSGLRKLLMTPRAQKSMRLSGLADMMETDEKEDDTDEEQVISASEHDNQSTKSETDIRLVDVKNLRNQKSTRLSGLVDLMKTPDNMDDVDNVRNASDNKKSTRRGRSNKSMNERSQVSVAPRTQKSTRLSNLRDMMDTSTDLVDSTPNRSLGKKSRRASSVSEGTYSATVMPKGQLEKSIGIPRSFSTPKRATDIDSEPNKPLKRKSLFITNYASPVREEAISIENGDRTEADIEISHKDTEMEDAPIIAPASISITKSGRKSSVSANASNMRSRNSEAETTLSSKGNEEDLHSTTNRTRKLSASFGKEKSKNGDISKNSNHNSSHLEVDDAIETKIDSNDISKMSRKSPVSENTYLANGNEVFDKETPKHTGRRSNSLGSNTPLVNSSNTNLESSRSITRISRKSSNVVNISITSEKEEINKVNVPRNDSNSSVTNATVEIGNEVTEVEDEQSHSSAEGASKSSVTVITHLDEPGKDNESITTETKMINDEVEEVNEKMEHTDIKSNLVVEKNTRGKKKAAVPSIVETKRTRGRQNTDIDQVSDVLKKTTKRTKKVEEVVKEKAVIIDEPISQIAVKKTYVKRGKAQKQETDIDEVKQVEHSGRTMRSKQQTVTEEIREPVETVKRTNRVVTKTAATKAKEVKAASNEVVKKSTLRNRKQNILKNDAEDEVEKPIEIEVVESAKKPALRNKRKAATDDNKDKLVEMPTSVEKVSEPSDTNDKITKKTTTRNKKQEATKDSIVVVPATESVVSRPKRQIASTNEVVIPAKRTRKERIIEVEKKHSPEKSIVKNLRRGRAAVKDSQKEVTATSRKRKSEVLEEVVEAKPKRGRKQAPEGEDKVADVKSPVKTRSTRRKI